MFKDGLTRVGKGIVDIPNLHFIQSLQVVNSFLHHTNLPKFFHGKYFCLLSKSKSRKAMGIGLMEMLGSFDKKGSKYQKLGEAPNNSRRNVISKV